MSPQAFLRKVITRTFEKSGVIIMTTSEEGVGNSAEDIYNGLLFARHAGEKLLILRRYSIFGNPIISNKELYALRSPYLFNNGPSWINIVGNALVTILFGHVAAVGNYLLVNAERAAKCFWPVLKYYVGGRRGHRPPIGYRQYRHHFFSVRFGLERIWNPSNAKTFSWDTAVKERWVKQMAEPLAIELEPHRKKRAELILREMGLGPEDWYVCLHVREGGFRKDRDNPRNGSIADCDKAIRAVTAAGGWVIRIGDATMTRLPPMDHVIDYPFTTFKSPFMDLYLIQNCGFFVGLNSGPLDVAHLFQKQTVLLSGTEFLLSPFPRKNSLAITQHIFSKRHNRFLSIQEQMDEPLSMHQFFGIDENYVFVKNTPDEICEVVLEALERFRNPNHEYAAVQLDFMKKRLEMIRRFCTQSQPLWAVEPGWLKSKNSAYGSVFDFDLLTRYRLATRAIDSQGTFGQKFLEQNWESHSMNSTPQPWAQLQQ